ncbi:MAG TPA: PH domain-containing protein [Candidatus Saccharimonadales bacterium]|nr:PH domain-containing protein [Candidatus Saccharimonadales bacterium]
MNISSSTDKYLHSKLPIDADEKILAVYRHHWFAYASSWILGIVVVIIIMSLATILTTIGDAQGALVEHRPEVLAIALTFSTLVLIGTSLPVYLRSQEQVVLTQEALLQVLQPSLFSSKIDQLSLQHIADVSVKQDFFGTILGYGQITIETPGEQDNYEFFMLPNPQDTAREIVAAHENFTAAIQGGFMPTTLGNGNPSLQQQPIDPAAYQQFLQYQRMMAQQQQSQAAQANDPTGGPADQTKP